MTAVQNAVSYASGPVAPDEIVILYGSLMCPTQLTPATCRLNWDASSIQRNPRLHHLHADRSSWRHCAIACHSWHSEYRSAVSPAAVCALLVRSGAASPGLFTARNGTGHAATNEDGSYNNASAPAKPGSIVTLYATCEGRTTPGGVNGKPATTPLPHPVVPVFVTIGGVRAEVDCAGGAPGEVGGGIQITVRIPARRAAQHRCAGYGSDRKRIQPNRCDDCAGSPESGQAIAISPRVHGACSSGSTPSDNEQQIFHPDHRSSSSRNT